MCRLRRRRRQRSRRVDVRLPFPRKCRVSLTLDFVQRHRRLLSPPQSGRAPLPLLPLRQVVVSLASFSLLTDFLESAHPADNTSVTSSTAPVPFTRPPSIPHPLAPPTPDAPPAPYLSSLTPVQHHLVRHAAAALLLKDHRHGRGVFEGIERVLERMWERGEEVGHGHGGGKGRPVSALRICSCSPSPSFPETRAEDFRSLRAELFGTPLKYLTKHEGVDSFHGANPHGTVRIPEFVNHCITALKMMGAFALVNLLTRIKADE